jgi:hypothetical protein
MDYRSKEIFMVSKHRSVSLRVWFVLKLPPNRIAPAEFYGSLDHFTNRIRGNRHTVFIAQG